MNELFNHSAAVALVLVPLVSGLTELVKATSLKPAFYPHASTLIGFLIGIVLGIVQGDGSLVLVGIIAGLSASGLYDQLGAVEKSKGVNR